MTTQQDSTAAHMAAIATDTYEVVDSRTGKAVASVTGLRAASRKAERLNQSYGAVRYSYRRQGVR